MSKDIIKVSELKEKHDRLFKKEPVSPLEVVYNKFNQFDYNVVRRPAGQCLGNLVYKDIHYDTKTGKYYSKSKQITSLSNSFIISEEWKDRVRCFILWNYGFGRYFPYNEFADAMYYDFIRYGRKSVPCTKELQGVEERCVKFFVRSEIDYMRRNTYSSYRSKFQEAHPEYFTDRSRRVFRCLNNELTKSEKIAACHAHKRDLQFKILDSLFTRISNNCKTLHSWFCEKTDSEGFKRLCFSDKAVESANNRLKKNGIRTLAESTLFKKFERWVRKVKGFRLVSEFIRVILIKVINKKLLSNTMKKVESRIMLRNYRFAFKNYDKRDVLLNENEAEIDFDLFEELKLTS